MEITYFESISSTNSVLLEKSKKKSKKNAKSWTVLWTKNQTNGRGYAGNVWEIEKDENLAFSFLIKCNLDYEDLIYFNQWVSYVLALNFSSKFDNVFIKWPNDIILNNKKVCGVLIETYKAVNELNIIVGVGVNVNQENFENLNQAGSLFTETGEKYDIEEILSDLLTYFESNYDLIQNESWNFLFEKYNELLFRKGIVSGFEWNGQLMKGIIQGVNHQGNLEVLFEDGLVKEFKTKDIKLIF